MCCACAVSVPCCDYVLCLCRVCVLCLCAASRGSMLRADWRTFGGCCAQNCAFLFCLACVRIVAGRMGSCTPRPPGRATVTLDFGLILTISHAFLSPPPLPAPIPLYTRPLELPDSVCFWSCVFLGRHSSVPHLIGRTICACDPMLFWFTLIRVYRLDPEERPPSLRLCDPPAGAVTVLCRCTVTVIVL